LGEREVRGQRESQRQRGQETERWRERDGEREREKTEKTERERQRETFDGRSICGSFSSHSLLVKTGWREGEQGERRR
jgi:hypothetical protein